MASVTFHSIPYIPKCRFYSSKILIHLTASKKRNRKASVLVLCVFFFCAFVFLIAPQNRKNIVIELCVIVCLSNRCLMPIKKIPTSHPAPMTKIAKNKCTNWLRFKRYGDPFKCYCCVEKRHICTHLHTHTHKEIWYLKWKRMKKRKYDRKK